jgi:hypothetical protein
MGDGKTTTVTEKPDGFVVSALLGPPQWDDGEDTIIAKITADNDDGTYEGSEQRRSSSGYFGSHTNGGLTFDSGNNGYLREYNGRAGVPVDNYVRVTPVYDDIGDVYYYFDATADVYGFGPNAGGGAWCEITANDGSGQYTAKQKDPDATTDSGVTGLTLYEVNGRDHIPVGTIVWARSDGSDYQFAYEKDSFWAKLTAESPSGTYSFTELLGDASTTTSRTGSAQEVHGRVGIIPSSTTIVRIFNDPSSPTGYKFEYHGATNGSPKEILTTSDSWDRDAQGANVGATVHFMLSEPKPELTSDGKLYVYGATAAFDGNGHLELINDVTKIFVGEFDETIIDCSAPLDPDDSSISTYLQAWWDVDDIGVADGAAVATWPDAAGSNDMTQSTASKKPLYSANQHNGHGEVVFDGTDDLLRCSGILSTTTHTVIVVARQDAGAYETLYGDYDYDPGVPTEYGMLLGFTSGGGVRGRTTDGANSADAATGGSGSGTLAVWAFVHRTASSKEVYKNGVSVGSSTNTLTPSFAGSMVASLGALVETSNGGAESSHLSGAICEGVIYNAGLSTPTILAISCGLMGKYGISG